MSYPKVGECEECGFLTILTKYGDSRGETWLCEICSHLTSDLRQNLAYVGNLILKEIRRIR